MKSLDALELWHSLGVSGDGHELLPLFDTFDRHPLLVRSLAGEVMRFRHAPGSYEQWRKADPKFDPFKLPLVQAKSHVLAFSLLGLEKVARKALNTIAAFRMPAAYDTLVALLVGPSKPCVDENVLDHILTELEDRGLLGWDKPANRYDLHPIVRGVIWNTLTNNARRGIDRALRAHFESLPES